MKTAFVLLLLTTKVSQVENAWVSRTSAADNFWTSVTYGNGLFVAVSSTRTGNRVMTSPDGVIWASLNSASNITGLFINIFPLIK